jgi:hypothetical protein
MKGNRKLAGSTIMALLLLTGCLIYSPLALAQAQRPAYHGTFTLSYPVGWGGSVLKPGKYSVTIKSTGSPVIALVRTADGDAITYVVSGSISSNTDGSNALLIRESRGELVVHSLALADLGMVLVYDPSLAHQQAKEAEAKRSIPVTMAKK